MLVAAALLAVGAAACGSGGSTSSTGSAEAGSGGSGAQSASGAGGNAKEEAAGAGSEASKGGGSQGANPSGGKSSGGTEGSGSSKGAGGGSAESNGAAGGKSSGRSVPRHHHDSGGGAAQFRTKGGDNSIQEFGGEAGGSELDQAAAALHAYLDARAAEEWGRACDSMASGVTKSLQQLAGGPSGSSGSGPKKMSCAEILAGLSAGLPPSALREAAQADVGALRIEGERAFLLFHGAHGTDYFMPMAKEGGEWKVAALAASALY